MRSRAGASALWWLLVCLVLVPTLGQVHHAAHGGPTVQATGAHAAHLTAPGHAGHRHGAALATDSADRATADALTSPLLDGLVPGHASADCLLLDQLAVGDALHLHAVPLPAATPVAASSARCAISHPAQPVALFEARGPPQR
ncbi:hypothetical protein [Acidovorax sp. BL-A-41-H1]|uniref:hypothetical protein n=1 Tax=Acidovorax sp. BL-A-41-H1 TaxID=3421102 RepID=UPI003F79FE67